MLFSSIPYYKLHFKHSEQYFFYKFDITTKQWLVFMEGPAISKMDACLKVDGLMFP